MPGGWLVGLGSGISKAGDIYADAKKQAIDRMFRERQLSLQQQQLESQIANQQSDNAFRIMGSLPENTQIDLDQFGPGGHSVVEAFSKMKQVPDQTSPLLGAHSLPMTTGAPTMDQTPVGQLGPNPAPIMRGQDLSPTVEKRVSVPTADSKLRAQELGIMSRNRIADQNNATRQQIAAAKLALASQMSKTTDAYRQQLIKQGWDRLDKLDQQIALQRTYQGAQMNNMDIDNTLDAWRAENPAGGGDNPFQMQLMRIMAESMGGGGTSAPGAVPGVPAAPAKPPRVAPHPTPVRGGGRVHVDPAVAPEDTPGSWEWFQKQKKAQGQP